MFEAAQLGRAVSREEYEAREPELRARLLAAQDELRQADFPVLVVIAGADGAGKGDTVNRLHEWLDARGVDTHAFGPPSDEESERPPFWRFWRRLPPRGRIAIYFGSWYTDPILDRIERRTKRAELEQAMEHVTRFERMLADDGALIVKFWFHLSRKAQRERLERLEKDPRSSWRVTKVDWKHFRNYERFLRVSEAALRATDAPHAPWILVEAADDRHRDLAVGTALLEAIQVRLARRAPVEETTAPVPPSPAYTAGGPGQDPVTILDRVPLSRKLAKAEYEERLAAGQARLNRLARRAHERGRSAVVVFEGWDAAGKGGAIRRLTWAMDARHYTVIPIAAPTDEEKAHHYLWRFWRHIPRAGMVTIFDRSWYGRVLVERVEGFARPFEWRRAYQEINEFEGQLSDAGIAVLKFWLHVDRKEQEKRFKERQQTPYKQHKITAEDWRNREKWEAYEAAVNDMVARTSTASAPWTIVAGNDKRWARIEVLDTVNDRLRRAVR
jgi:polyphosphate:AMP phosphotransferase